MAAAIVRPVESEAQYVGRGEVCGYWVNDVGESGLDLEDAGDGEASASKVADKEGTGMFSVSQGLSERPRV